MMDTGLDELRRELLERIIKLEAEIQRVEDRFASELEQVSDRHDNIDYKLNELNDRLKELHQ